MRSNAVWPTQITLGRVELNTHEFYRGNHRQSGSDGHRAGSHSWRRAVGAQRQRTRWRCTLPRTSKGAINSGKVPLPPALPAPHSPGVHASFTLELPPLRAFRLFKIIAIAFRFGLDEFFMAAAKEGVLKSAYQGLFGNRSFASPRGVRLRQALEALGPIFVKFGQVLSTRRDLLPADIADAG